MSDPVYVQPVEGTVVYQQPQVVALVQVPTVVEVQPAVVTHAWVTAPDAPNANPQPPAVNVVSAVVLATDTAAGLIDEEELKVPAADPKSTTLRYLYLLMYIHFPIGLGVFLAGASILGVNGDQVSGVPVVTGIFTVALGALAVSNISRYF